MSGGVQASPLLIKVVDVKREKELDARRKNEKLTLPPDHPVRKLLFRMRERHGPRIFPSPMFADIEKVGCFPIWLFFSLTSLKVLYGLIFHCFRAWRSITPSSTAWIVSRRCTQWSMRRPIYCRPAIRHGRRATATKTNGLRYLSVAQHILVD